jgi:diadenosine tetraphosphate (Ap4A) HIT family hydrolase
MRRHLAELKKTVKKILKNLKKVFAKGFNEVIMDKQRRENR